MTLFPSHEGDTHPEGWRPSRGFGITVACGEQRHDTCPGVRQWDAVPWGPCTCACHREQTVIDFNGPPWVETVGPGDLL